MSAVLELDPAEDKAVHDYEDDSIEPLAGIVLRWVKALDRKGRVPF
jgi:hypothetical protein